MSVEVDVVARSRRKNKDEDDNHEGGAEDLTLDHGPKEVQPIPVQNDIPNYNPDYAIKRCRGPSTRSIALSNCIPKDVS